MHIILPKRLSLGILAFFIFLLSSISSVSASSHRDAPLISQDPAADATDIYAFVSPEKPDTVTIIADYIALEEGAVDSNNLLSDNVLYAIHIDNDGDAVEDITYQYRFKTEILNDTSLLYSPNPVESLSDPDFHVRQTYTLTRIEKGVSTELGRDLPVPPVNIGPKSMPDYEKLSNEAIKTVGDGIQTFVGQADDPFFVDIGSLIDIITIREPPGNTGGGVDGIAGFNTHALALQIPIEQLTKTKTRITDTGNVDAVIGIWTSSYRPATQVIKNGKTTGSGEWVSVSRVGVPLTNDFFVPVAMKDFWNTTHPKDDAQFFNYITDPGIAKNIHDLYGIRMPPQGAYGTATARNDLFTLLMTGIPGLNQPKNVVPAEELRLNTAILPSENPNRMGVPGGDNQGYPNGRRLIDDVIDISLRAAGGAVYAMFVDKDYKPDPTALLLGDGVDQNDKPFRPNFPYVALPLSGYDSIPHGNHYVAPKTEAIPAVANSPAIPETHKSNDTTTRVLLGIIVLLVLGYIGVFIKIRRKS